MPDSRLQSRPESPLKRSKRSYGTRKRSRRPTSAHHTHLNVRSDAQLPEFCKNLRGMIVFGVSLFLRSMIQCLPATAAQFSKGSRTTTAKSRRTQIVLSGEERERLERIKTDPHSMLKHVRRATIIFHLGDGLTLSQTMRATGMSKPTVWRWWDRFLKGGGTACFTTSRGEGVASRYRRRRSGN